MTDQDDAMAFFSQSMEDAMADIGEKDEGTGSAPPVKEEEPRDEAPRDQDEEQRSGSRGFDTQDAANRQEFENNDLYRKWFRRGDNGGFLTVSGWVEHQKVAFDVGTTAGSKLVESAKAWSDGLNVVTYLAAVVNDSADRLYPKNPKMGAPCNESYVDYGGTNKGGNAVSRIIKIHPTKYEDDGSPVSRDRFTVKVGHFKARTSKTGAFIPNMSDPISIQSIQMTLVEMHQLYHKLNSWFIASEVVSLEGK